jgi:hypothetical protein
MNNYDTIIIGAGPAGISCAIYLKRYGLNPLVIGNNQTVLYDAHQIENYYGIKSISGADLYNEGINQAKSLGIDVINDEAIDIVFETPFVVKTKEAEYSANTIVLALGSPKNKMAKAKKFEGEGVSYCAVCDGFFFRKKKTGLVGSGDYMLHELEVLKQMIPDLTVFTNGVHVTSQLLDGVKVVEEKIVSFNGDSHLESITTDKQTYEIYGCADCSGCEHKAKCLYKYNPEKDIDKNKIMKINEQWEELKSKSHANIESEKGILNRQIRSIQTEGHFGDIKENENFRRFNHRSSEKVYKEFMLYAIGRNINKYHRFLHNEIKKFEGKQEAIAS